MRLSVLVIAGSVSVLVIAGSVSVTHLISVSATYCKNSPLICLALLEFTIADLSQTMTNTTTKDNRGGTREGAGAKPLHEQHVQDASKFPRLETFFSKKSSASTRDSSSETAQSVQPGTKRARSSLREATPSTPVMFAPLKEPPEIAPVASSFLLGNKGIIAQALVALRTGIQLLVCGVCN